MNHEAHEAHEEETSPPTVSLSGFEAPPARFSAAQPPSFSFVRFVRFVVHFAFCSLAWAGRHAE
jgi:hypothetical protein